jgi:LacI family transcriptional regulator
VHIDNHVIGRAAAEHLLELGLKRFAFVGHLAWYHNHRCLADFQETVEKAGHVCRRLDVVFRPKRRRRSGPSDLNLVSLERALSKLTPPVGIFAAHDEFAHDVVELLRGTGVRVPDDAAVIGVNNYTFRVSKPNRREPSARGKRPDAVQF